MARFQRSRWIVATLAFVSAASVGLLADRLVLRDGQVIEGRLVGVSATTAEFEERLGWFKSRVHRISRADILSIEFSEASGRGISSRPRGLREREATVMADTRWTDTGIDLRLDQTMYFEATGRVRWGPDRRDGPAGERNSPRNDNRPIPRRPAAALIGRIGDAPDAFFIGDERGPIRAPAAGRLFLGINDDYLQDNSGSFRVTVSY